MNVDFSGVELVADRVWYDVHSDRLYLQAGGIQSSILLRNIPDHDFESTAPLIGFSIGQSGSVVVCHHRDGKDTWLPVDLWLPANIGASIPPRT
jgi:hypothetical protein